MADSWYKRGFPRYGSHTANEGRVMDGAQALIAALEAEGVEELFGYPGGQAIRIYDALYDSTQLRHILARHEQGATHAADGYARATGRPGVVLVTSGPGATNTVTGIATAYMDSIPLVVITAQVPTRSIGTDAFQESDIFGITMPIVKHSYLVKDSAELLQTLRDAFYVAETGRPGPVLVDIPSDILAAQIPFHYFDESSLAGYKPTTRPNGRQVRAAYLLLKQAKRPVVYAGGGIVAAQAQDELAALAQQMQAPVVTTLMGKNALSAQNPFNLGFAGMHGSKFANLALNGADVLIAVGARFSDRITGKAGSFAPHAKVIHIDVDPAEIGKNRSADVPIVGDAKAALAALGEEIGKHGLRPDTADWLEQVRAWQAAFPLAQPGIRGKDGAISPEGLMRRLDDLLDPSAIVVTDVGQHQMWAAQYLRQSEPRSFVTSGGAGTMGFGLPAAVGASVGNPDRDVVCVSGDGSFQMCIQEMAVARVNDLPVKVLLLNNGALGMVRQWQHLFYRGRYSATLLDDVPDFVKIAQAYGWGAWRVEEPEAADGALERLLDAQGPTLLEVRIPAEEKVFPMVAPGSALEDQIGAVSVGDISQMIDCEDASQE